MTIRNLRLLFQPRSVVLVGASERPGSIGLHVAENLLRGGFAGEIAFVNPSHDTILGRPCYRSVDSLPLYLSRLRRPSQRIKSMIPSSY